MGQVKTGKFTATGAAMNHDIGFIPAYARYLNGSAAVDEVMILEYFNQNGDAQEFWHYSQINDGGSSETTPIKKSSGGYLSEYDTTSVGLQRSVTFDDTGGTAEDLLTCANTQQVPINGDVLKFVESGGLPTNLDERTNYYVIDSEEYGTGTFRISTTSPQSGDTQSAVDLGSDGTGTNYFINVSNPGEVDVTGGKGLTISASFTDDGDTIYFRVEEADMDQNLGDAADW